MQSFHNSQARQRRTPQAGFPNAGPRSLPNGGCSANRCRRDPMECKTYSNCLRACMSVASPELMRWLMNLRKQVVRTNPGFAVLNPTGWPIPFFGDIGKARVLTVGVNPAPSEFTPPARWATVTNDDEWADRLLNYFHVPGVPWHQWFLPSLVSQRPRGWRQVQVDSGRVRGARSIAFSLTMSASYNCAASCRCRRASHQGRK